MKKNVLVFASLFIAGALLAGCQKSAPPAGAGDTAAAESLAAAGNGDNAAAGSAAQTGDAANTGGAAQTGDAAGTGSTAQTGDAAGTAARGAGEITWPEGDVRLLNGFAAGGDIDVCVRFLAEALTSRTGKNIFVENMKGANGSLAMEEIMNSNDPENNFLVINTSALSANAATGLTDKSYEDMEPVSVFSSYSGEVLYAAADAPYDTWEEFVEYTKNSHVKLGIPMGGALYAAVAAMNDYGLNLDIVDAGDASERMTSLIGKQLDCTIASYALGRDYIEKGSLKQIVTLCSEPIPDAPDLACANTIIPNAVIDTKFAILAQKGTDPAVIQTFSDLILACYEQDPKYVENIEGYTYQSAEPLTLEETRKQLKEQYELFQGFKDFLK